MRTRKRPTAQDEEVELTDEQQREVDKRKQAPPLIVHEVVRQQGVEEMERPLQSLLWSGWAAGVAIWLSVIVQAGLMLHLPPGPARELIAPFGYSVGFIVVILGRLQLFTESTITAIIPLATDLTRKDLGRNLTRTLRLWSAVFVANMAGSLAVALIVPWAGLVAPDHFAAMLELSRHLQELTPTQAFTRGIPAGFILATIAWTLPSVRGQEVWLIGLLTYVVSLCGFSHVVAGSGEAWLLATTGTAGWDFAIGGFILPALAGNIVGGTLLFAVLAHAQVRAEL